MENEITAKEIENMKLTMKELAQIQIAMKIDELDYEKNSLAYFEKMPSIKLGESQLIYVNKYVEILEHKDDERKAEFAELMNRIKKENDSYQKLLEKGSKSTLIKKFSKMTGYLVRQLEKYQRLY